MKNKKTFYVTTPIYYPTAKPHLGTAYTTIAADILARWHKLLGEDVFFLTGTDEHGQKLDEAAKKVGKNPKEYVDELVKEFKNVWKELNINFDEFIRTTDKKHSIGSVFWFFFFALIILLPLPFIFGFGTLLTSALGAFILCRQFVN